ncbi:MAG: hypothetical protein ACI9YH_001408 [Colwellia sp.]
MNIAVVPWSHHFSGNELFSLTSKHNFDHRLNPFSCLKSNLLKDNHSINTIDLYDGRYQNLDVILFFRIDYSVLYQALKSGFKGKMIYFAWEPPVVSKEHSAEQLVEFLNMFDSIMTWNDDLVNDDGFYKITFPQWFNINSKKYQNVEFQNKKLLTNISMDKSSFHPDELYTARKNIIDYFESHSSENFDFYGMRWKTNTFKNYKGICDDKIEVYSKYKFSVCFENMKDNKGYITEKLFDCFKAGIIPIYWGAPNVCDYIPEGCFINYERFKNVSEMYQYISQIDENQYNEFKRNISDFLASESIKVFEETFLRKQLLKVINKKTVTSNKILRLGLTCKYLIIREHLIKCCKDRVKRILGRPIY